MAFVPYEFEFFVTESDYPKLQAACPGDFPASYEKFVAVIDERIERRLEQVTTRKAYIDVSEFLSYCARTERTASDTNAQIAFAQLVGNNQVPT